VVKAPVEISPVRSKRELKEFIRLPWKLYAGDPNWVPPLRRMLRRLLDDRKHPYWQFSRRQLFLARVDGQTVGRIMAHVDNNHNQYHQEKMGAWGFFESINDPRVSRALFDAARDYHLAQGMEFMRGPLNPSTNYEVGMLVEGFDQPPVLMMAYNPPYYRDLAADYGFSKEKGLLAFFNTRARWHSWDLSRARRIAERGNISIRLRGRDFLEEVRLLNRIYRDCWSDNWGFVPMTDGEIVESAKGLRPLLSMVSQKMLFFLCHRGKEVGGCVVLPDFNQVQIHLNGSLGPWSLLKILWYRRKMDNLRCLMLGVPKGIRRAGFALVALDQVTRAFGEDKRFNSMEMGWTLEDNQDINRLLLHGGAEPYKRYCIYRKDL